MVPGFTLGRVLGEGQQAVVYEARDDRSGRVVALKTLRAELVQDAQARRRFHREARALMQVVHPNVVSVFDYSGADVETLWIAEEVLSGQSLKALVDEKGPLQPMQCAQLFAQVMAGLAAAHAQGLLHRDFSLSNVFVEASGRAVVTDFGLVTAASGAKTSETFVSRNTGIVGTPLYFAPETLLTGEYSAQSDLYAVGMAMTYALLGKSPVPTGDIAGLLKAIIDGTVPLLPESADLSEIINPLRARDPRARPWSASDVAHELEAWIVSHRGETTQVVEEGSEPGGRYRVERPLGEGGMAQVFLAWDRVLDRQVAFKTMQDPGDDDARMRFHREARAMGRLRHPNIVEVFDYSGPSVRKPYIVLGFVDGRTCEGLQPGEGGALAIVLQIANALALVHAEGFVHRDIKPENVFLDARGHVVLGDFGIVRGMGESGTFAARQTRAIGSPYFASPEQLFDPANAGPASDVFSLGSLLFALLTGRMPVVGASITELVTRLGRGEMEPLGPGVSADVAALVTAMHARTPAERPSIAAVGQLVREALERRGVTDLRGAVLESGTRVGAVLAPARRASRWPLIVAGLLSVVLVSAGVWLLRARPPAPRPQATSPDTLLRPSAAPHTTALPPPNDIPIPPSPPDLTDPATAHPHAHPPVAPAPPQSVTPNPTPAVAPPPAAKPKPAEPATVRFITKPWAKVIVDGKVLGTTPAFQAAELSPGAHTVRFENPAYKAAEQTLTLKTGEQRDVRIQLTKD